MCLEEGFLTTKYTKALGLLEMSPLVAMKGQSGHITIFALMLSSRRSGRSLAVR